MPDESKISRLEKRLDDDVSVDMPDVEGFETILDYLSELGYVNRGFNGSESLTYSDVSGWNNATGCYVDQWVIRMLVDLSRDYCYQASISGAKLCPPPYVMEIDDYDLETIREAVDTKIRGLFA